MCPSGRTFARCPMPWLACLKTYMGLGLDGYRQGILYQRRRRQGKRAADPVPERGVGGMGALGLVR